MPFTRRSHVIKPPPAFGTMSGTDFLLILLGVLLAIWIIGY